MNKQFSSPAHSESVNNGTFRRSLYELFILSLQDLSFGVQLLLKTFLTFTNPSRFFSILCFNMLHYNKLMCKKVFSFCCIGEAGQTPILLPREGKVRDNVHGINITHTDGKQTGDKGGDRRNQEILIQCFLLLDKYKAIYKQILFCSLSLSFTFLELFKQKQTIYHDRSRHGDKHQCNTD